MEQWSDVENVYVLVDDLSAHHGPGEILAPDELLMSDDEHYAVASARRFPATGLSGSSTS